MSEAVPQIIRVHNANTAFDNSFIIELRGPNTTFSVIHPLAKPLRCSLTELWRNIERIHVEPEETIGDDLIVAEPLMG